MCASTQSLASMGRGGDTELAHVNPQEKAMLIKMGGSGTTNPRTGLREYQNTNQGQFPNPFLVRIGHAKSEPKPTNQGQFDINAFLKTHEDAAALGLWGDDLQDYLTSHNEDWYSKPVEPPKTTTAKPPKDTETYNSANKDAIIKQLNEAHPLRRPQSLSGFYLTNEGLEQNFKYNPDTDSFDPYLTFEGKEYTIPEIQELLKEEGDKAKTLHNQPSPEGTSSDDGGGLLDILNDLVGNVKGGLPDLTNIDLTDIDLADVDLTDIDLSGGASVSTDQDLTEVDLTDIDLSGGHSVNTTQDLAEAATEGLESIQDLGTTVIEQAAEGAESATELIDATITGIGEQQAEGAESTGEAVTFLEEQAAEGAESLTEAGTFLEEQLAEGAESATDFLSATQDFVHDVQVGVNPTEILQNPYEVLYKKPKERLDAWLNQAEEEITETTEAIKKIPVKIGETGEKIGAAATETFQTGMETATQTGINAGAQVTQAKDDLVRALVAAGLITINESDDSPEYAQAIMEGDPRMLSLLTRRRQARKRGKAQLRKGGGLYIPLKTGIQVPAA